MDVTNPDLAVTSLTHNLTARPLEQNRTLCRASLQEGCCRCFLKKPCLDDGCRAAFGGAGVCVDIERGDLSTVDLTAGKREGLCKSTGVKDCCHCYRRGHTLEKVCQYLKKIFAQLAPVRSSAARLVSAGGAWCGGGRGRPGPATRGWSAGRTAPAGSRAVPKPPSARTLYTEYAWPTARHLLNLIQTNPSNLISL